MKIKAMLKDVDARENSVQMKIVRKYSHACPRIKLQRKHL
jgi:hypothetical protein